MMRPFLAALLTCCVLSAPALAADATLTAAASQAYLAANAHKPGVVMRPSGLQVRVIHNGVGRHSGPADAVKLYYTAHLIDGTVIDGTSMGLPVVLQIGNVLPGLSEALQSMREGDHWEVTLPPALGFGSKGGANGVVPPDQALIFDVTLLTTASPAAQAAAGPQGGLSITGNSREPGAMWTIRQ